MAGLIAYFLTKMPSEEETGEASTEEIAEEPNIESYLELDPLSLEIGYGLIPLVDQSNGELL